VLQWLAQASRLSSLPIRTAVGARVATTHLNALWRTFSSSMSRARALMLKEMWIITPGRLATSLVRPKRPGALTWRVIGSRQRLKGSQQGARPSTSAD